MKGMKNLARFGKKHIVTLIAIIALSTILQVLYSYLPLFVQYAIKALTNEIDGTGNLNVNLPKWLIDILAGQSNILSLLLVVGASMIILQAFRSFMRFYDNYLTGKLTQDISRDMRIAIYDHVGELPYSYHNKMDTGDLIQRSTSDIDTSSGFISNQIPSLLNIFVTIFMGAYQVYFICPTLMWVSLIIVPVSGITSVIYFRYVNKSFQKIEEAESKMTTIIQENVNSARIVRAFSNEKFEYDKMNKANREYANKDQKFVSKMAIFWGASDCSVMLQYAITISVSIFLAQKGLVDAGDITACLLLMGMLVWPIRGLGRIIADFGKTLVAVNRIQEVLDEKSEFTDNGTLKPEITGNIEFKDVCFKFDDGNSELLHGVTFDIKKGEMVAIVGKTGSGKSTICNLLTRMLDYSDGHILIDGVELKDIEKHYLRQNIKLVLQDPFLYSKSIYDNIAITNKNLSEENIYKAATLANIHDEVKQFEKGYHTLVGEKGTTLSGGQKQRVAIARILVDNAPVVIFDDSLSALDTKTDLLIRKALKENNSKQTMIVITHRTTTAKEADKIIVLDNGKVAEIGTHAELQNKDGLYKELWGIQGELEKEFKAVMEGSDC